ncbi:sigma-70 family RNA polymerase sigma factor [Alicyclobacillus tolerans]|uniref:RNA polymerase sigma factor n=1 Tax=Alicyclobacillus tolerans TaxID=90970 RepID=UPI003555D987|nr:sigma-70 family RNA polymerase sigma factor [Alicyclobacillus tolerans]
MKGGAQLERSELISSWVHDYADRLAFIAYTHVHNQKTAEDLVQETFIRAFRSIDQLRDVDNPLPWLIRIVINLCHTTKRRGWKEVVVSETPSRSVTTGPEDLYIQRTRDRELHQAVMSLPQTYRTPIVLFYFEELSINEIAEALNIHSGTARTRLSRARKQLETILERSSHHAENFG